MNQLTERQEKPPGPQGTERLQCDARSLIDRIHHAGESSGPPDISRDQFMLLVLNSVARDYSKIETKFKALMQPATKLQIANHLGLLVKSFPNAGKDDAQVYGRMLPEDVAAQRPTVGGIEMACRNLRRSSRFIPVIADVLAALDEAEAAQRHILRVLADIPQRRDKFLARIKQDADEREKFRIEIEAHAANQRLIEQNQDGQDLPF